MGRTGILKTGELGSQMAGAERTAWRWMQRMASGMMLTVEDLPEDVLLVLAVS